MLCFNENRSQSLEECLKEGYGEMGDLNVWVGREGFGIECEGWDWNETYLTCNGKNE